ncbi:unnamed protein product, partial [Ixodes hexagonus]
PHLWPPSPGPLPRAVAVRRRSRRQRRSRHAHHGTHDTMRRRHSETPRRRAKLPTTNKQTPTLKQHHSTPTLPRRERARARKSSSTVRRRRSIAAEDGTEPASSARLALNEGPGRAGRRTEGGREGGGRTTPLLVPGGASGARLCDVPGK